MFRAIMCPSSGADDCVVLSPRVGIVPWLQEGCQNRLAGSVSIEEFVARCATQKCHQVGFLSILTKRHSIFRPNNFTASDYIPTPVIPIISVQPLRSIVA